MITVFDNLEQGTAEWFKARAGIPTASEFHTVMAKGRGGGESVTRRKYLMTLAAQRLSGRIEDSYSNPHMERGKEIEDEARALYMFHSDADVQQVGFVRNDALVAGASPDGLIGTDGGLEIKTRLGGLQLELLLSGTLPPEHKAQVQGCMAVSGRSWWDFFAYSKGLPHFLVRVERDEPYIAAMRIAIQDFNAELNTIVEKFS